MITKPLTLNPYGSEGGKIYPTPPSSLTAMTRKVFFFYNMHFELPEKNVISLSIIMSEIVKCELEHDL